MKAVVVYPFTDKKSGEVCYAGERIELEDERFDELRRAGFVSLDAGEQEEPTGEADAGEPEEPTGEADAGEPEEPAEGGADAGEKTAAELRAEIEAKGGFAPKRATKAQLSDILGTL